MVLHYGQTFNYNEWAESHVISFSKLLQRALEMIFQHAKKYILEVLYEKKKT